MFLEHFLSFFLWLLCWQRVYVSAQFASNNNFWPASWPLAVRSPYLNTWIDTTSGTQNLDNWPRHWDDASIMGWSGSVRVDGNGFNWLGATGNATVLENAAITPTQSSFIVRVGNLVRLNITFLSPIEPNDLVKQSMPFSYLSVSVSSADGQPHNVQLYSDISAEWISGDRSNIANWNVTQTSKSTFHTAYRATGVSMQEIANIAEDAYVYYGIQNAPKVTYQSGADATVRGQFATNGALTGGSDTQFRAIQDHFVVFGLAADLGTITTSTAPVVWTLGLARDPVAQYAGNGGAKQNRRSYFWTKYNSISDAIDDFITDFPNAIQRSAALDAKILADANKVSANYADLVSMGLRQTMAAMDITVGENSDGSLDLNDVKAFVRDMGNGRRVNPVEVLYASFPTLMYLNPQFGRLVLEPLLQYQSSSTYPNQFAAPDLGPSYPSAMGNNDPTGTQGVEDSGNMLLMTWAHATFSGDGTLIGNYYNRLKSYADYLVPNSLAPSGQLVDGLSKTNMTNLALKGILGIRAMGEISRAAKITADATNYTNVATSYIKQWTNLANSNGHLLSSYTSTSSPAIIYNLFADQWLGFKIVGTDIYAAQTNFYASEASTVSNSPFGLPFDGSGTFAKSHWTLFAAAAATDLSTRNALINQVHSRATLNLTNPQIGSLGAFPSTYDVGTGKVQSGQASAAQGAMLAPIALNLSPNSSITVPAAATTSGSSNNTKTTSGLATGAIVGIVIGILVVFVLVLLLIFLFIRRKRERNQEMVQQTQPQPLTPGSFMAGGLNSGVHPQMQYGAVVGGDGAYEYQPYNQAGTGYQNNIYQGQPNGSGGLGLYPQRAAVPSDAPSISERSYGTGMAPPRHIATGPGPGSLTDVYDTAYAQNAYSVGSGSERGAVTESERSASDRPRYSTTASSRSGGAGGAGAGVSGGGKASEAGWSVSNRSQSADLRNEVEVLRREMNQLKYELQPPPEYD